MPRKPRLSTEGPAPSGLALAMKDSLRDLRFHLQHGARSLARRIEVTVQRFDDLDGPLGTLPKLGEPIGAAVRGAAQLLRTADDAAIDLLRPNDDYRQANFRLQPWMRFFAPGVDDADAARALTKTLYWSVRHLLRLKGIDDAVVHEQAAHQVFRRVHADMGATLALAGRDDTGGSGHGLPPPTAAALLAASVLRHCCDSDGPALVLRRAGADEPDRADDAPGARAAAGLLFHCSTAAVLAGEIAALVPQPVAQQETRAALTLADEIATACATDWQQALRAPEPLVALARQLAFTLKHV